MFVSLHQPNVKYQLYLDWSLLQFEKKKTQPGFFSFRIATITKTETQKFGNTYFTFGFSNQRILRNIHKKPKSSQNRRCVEPSLPLSSFFEHRVLPLRTFFKIGFSVLNVICFNTYCLNKANELHFEGFFHRIVHMCATGHF